MNLVSAKFFEDNERLEWRHYWDIIHINTVHHKSSGDNSAVHEECSWSRQRLGHFVPSEVISTSWRLDWETSLQYVSTLSRNIYTYCDDSAGDTRTQDRIAVKLSLTFHIQLWLTSPTRTFNFATLYRLCSSPVSASQQASYCDLPHQCVSTFELHKINLLALDNFALRPIYDQHTHSSTVADNSLLVCNILL